MKTTPSSRAGRPLLPLTPLFDPEKKLGGITVGNTPRQYDYDELVIDLIGAMWYVKGDQLPVVVWPTLEEAIAQDVASESVRGRIYFEHWYLESGYAPADYDAAVDPTLDPIWYSTVDSADTVTWPTWVTVIATDMANEDDQGRIWFERWFAESGYAPIDYTEAISASGFLGDDLMWYSTLDVANAIIWPDFATVMAGDYANESNQGRIWFEAWYVESGYAPATYADAIDENDPIWYCPADQLL